MAWISPNGKSSLPVLVMTNLPTYVSCSSSASIGSSDCVLVNVNISLVLLRELPQCHRVWQIGRDCKQPSLFRTHLPYVLPLMLTQPGNSSTETCSLSLSHSRIHSIPSHLIFRYSTLLPAHGTLNPVVRQLL